MKTLKKILFVTLPTIFIVLIILEVFFRTVIPASDPPRGFYYEKEKMWSFSNKKRKGICTFGRFAEIRTRWSLNNMIWNYPIDYYPKVDKKLIAVIGDSYIEAFAVNVGENYPFLLREKLKNDYEVYAFGKSGAPLSQYLHISRYVNKHFDPDILIFNLVHNDFDESIQELYPNNYRFLQVSINEHDSITETIPHKPLKKFINKSALVRYLFFNLHADILLTTKKNYEANINADDVKKNKALIFKSTNYLVKTIREENSDKRIIFVIDAPRSNIYKNTLNKSNVLWMNEMMRNICANNNIEYIDLTPYMLEDFQKNGKRFESDYDSHWNEYGHEFVANVLYEYLKNNH